MPKSLPKRTARKPINLILLGDPAAGKATQAEFLTKRYGLYDFDMGRELWALRNREPEIDAFLKNNYDQGKLTPTKIVRDILKRTIAGVPAKQGILFDGHPKMLGEAKIAARLLKIQHRQDPLVIYLSIPLDETVRRMRDRVGYFAGKFGKRADDSDAGLKNRVKYYRINIAQVIDFFSKHYQFHKISALGTKAEVRSRIEQIIKEHFNGE